MTQSSDDILNRFRHVSTKDIALTKPYSDLLHKLGDPHLRLPPVAHVAGTNGKGSTCAFLRAMAEAAGYKVHVYTSPHLVRFHERIRIAGELIGEDELVEILTLCEKLGDPATVTGFEAATAAAFVAFARHPADLTILEVGLGGRLDATNMVPKPAATVITRLSYDHREFLGHTLTQIAAEKAGIMREGVPCFTAPQPSVEALDALRQAAASLHVPLSIGGIDWQVTPREENGFRYSGPRGVIDLPAPALLGQHQWRNAGLAIATLDALPFPIPDTAIRQAMHRVEWPGRLQPLREGALSALLPAGWELWLDGGHNDSAGEVLAAQAAAWRQQDGATPRPLHLVFGMLSTKAAAEFLGPLTPYIHDLRTVDIIDEPLAYPADKLAELAQAAGIVQAASAPSVPAALKALAAQGTPPSRILICGSLYLAGQVLKLNQQAP